MIFGCATKVQSVELMGEDIHGWESLCLVECYTYHRRASPNIVIDTANASPDEGSGRYHCALWLGERGLCCVASDLFQHAALSASRFVFCTGGRF